MLIVAALLCGFIFGAGLLISEMVQPAKVLAFLDIFGAWDPSLAVVMVGALAVAVPGFMLANRARPLLAPQGFWPTKSDIDRPLMIGAAIFGIGWGLVGLCPGPALVNLVTLSPGVFMFVAAMAGGMTLHNAWQKSRLGTKPETAPTDADG